MSAKYTVEHWERMNEAEVPSDSFESDGILAKPKQGMRSKVEISVRPGDVYKVSYDYKITSAPTNSEPVNFYIGPLFFDKENRRIKNWKLVLLEDPVEIADAAMRTFSESYEVVVPEGAVSARLGLSGSWQKGGDPSDVVFRVSNYSVDKFE